MMITTTDTSRSAAMARPDTKPLLVSIPETKRQLGGIGTTTFYEIVRRHRIKLVRLGTRSLVPMAEIERVVTELMTAANDKAEATAKAVELAAKSAAARRAKRTP